MWRGSRSAASIAVKKAFLMMMAKMMIPVKYTWSGYPVSLIA